MPIYTESPGVWRVRIWWKGRSRSWIVRGLKSDASAFEARMRMELARGETPASRRVVPRLETYCSEHYVPYLQTMVAKETLRVRMSRLAALLAELGDLRLNELDPATPSYQQTRRKAGIAASTVNDELKVLRACVNHARTAGLTIPPLRARFLKVPKRRDRVKVWGPDEMRRLFTACEEHVPRILPLVVLAAYTGMRPGEAPRLRMSSVDLEAGLVWVEPSEAWQPKDREARSIPISPDLRPWLERRKDEKWYAVSTRGKPWSDWPDAPFALALKQAKLVGHPHMLRHTYASTWLAAGGDVFTLSQVLGHSDVRITLDTYAHLIPGHLQASASLVSYGASVGPAAAEAAARWGNPRGRRNRP